MTSRGPEEVGFSSGRTEEEEVLSGICRRGVSPERFGGLSRR